jgi:hypothetical protein
MAKAKKEKIKVEEKPELPIEQPLAPESVTLDEVKEVEAPIVETDKEPIPVIEKSIEQIKEVQSVTNEEISMEQKIMEFIENKGDVDININQFLKSLYPLPKIGEPALWLSKGENKRLRNLLDSMVKKGAIKILNNLHMRLGQFYHETQEQRTMHHDLNTVEITVKK